MAQFASCGQHKQNDINRQWECVWAVRREVQIHIGVESLHERANPKHWAQNNKSKLVKKRRTNKIHIHPTQIVFFLFFFAFCIFFLFFMCFVLYAMSVRWVLRSFQLLATTGGRCRHASSIHARQQQQCASTNTHTNTESLHASARVTRQHETNLSTHILSHPISRTQTNTHTLSPTLLLSYSSCRYPRAHTAAHFLLSTFQLLLLLLLLLLLPFCHHQRHQ